MVLWRHCHDDEECHVHASTVPLVIIGDAVHTFVDGIVIAAATLTSVPLGITTALAVVAHEIPQEAGDFAVLLSAGQSRRRAVLLNVASAGGGVAGAALMLPFGSQAPTSRAVRPGLCCRQLHVRGDGGPDSQPPSRATSTATPSGKCC